MAAVLQDTFLRLVTRALRSLPTLAELRRSMTSDALRDGSRYL